jgi:replication factor A2
MSIKMIETIEEDLDAESLKLKDGRLVGTMKLIGRVQEIEAREGFKAILIDDTSAFLTIRDYKDEREGNKMFNEGDYVRIYGTCKKAKGGNGFLFNAFEIIKLSEVDQQDHFTSHFAEVIATHLHYKHEKENKSSNVAQQNKTSNFNAAQDFGSGGGAVQSLGNKKHEMVLTVVKNCDTDSGVNRHNDFNHLGLSATDIAESLEWLSEEGHIYSTIDDDHFKTT